MLLFPLAIQSYRPDMLLLNDSTFKVPVGEEGSRNSVPLVLMFVNLQRTARTVLLQRSLLPSPRERMRTMGEPIAIDHIGGDKKWI